MTMAVHRLPLHLVAGFIATGVDEDVAARLVQATNAATPPADHELGCQAPERMCRADRTAFIHGKGIAIPGVLYAETCAASARFSFHHGVALVTAIREAGRDAGTGALWCNLSL